MPTVDANGETLFYEVTGVGPPLLLLHAVGAKSDSWGDLTNSLADRFTIYGVDLRGHGASSLNGSMTIEEMAHDLEAMLAALDIPSCHVIASSLGALVAVTLAASRPDLVKMLAVSGVGLSPDPVLTDEVYGIREAVHYLTDDDFAYQVAEALLIPDAPQSSINGLRDGILAQSKQNYLRALEAIERGDLAARAPNVSAPTLVVHGTMDELVPATRAEALAKALPDGTLLTLDDAGQISYLDNPAGFLAVVSDFLERQV